MRLGEAFKILREKLELKQSDICSITDNNNNALVSNTTLSRWETGKQGMGVDRVITLLDKIDDVSMLDLLYIATESDKQDAEIGADAALSNILFDALGSDEHKDRAKHIRDIINDIECAYESVFQQFLLHLFTEIQRSGNKLPDLDSLEQYVSQALVAASRSNNG